MKTTIVELGVSGMRNLHRVDLEPGPHINVIAGDNGQGKTNLLEAIYVLATSKSFRTPKPADLVSYGGAIGTVRGRITEAGDARTQAVAVQSGARMVRIDGKRPASLAAYAVVTPVVLFHPGELALSMGGGAERRRLLDRVALYIGKSAEHRMELESYRRAVLERQRTLETRGERAADLDAWEELIVRHGLAVMCGRRDAAERLRAAADRRFARVAAPGLTLEMSYAPSAPEDGDAYVRAVRDRRTADCRRGTATLGPHRDDVRLMLNDHPVRLFASQGQHRMIVLTLKSSEMDVIASCRDTLPILLLDDVSSELDSARASSFFRVLGEESGQVFLTTTRPELIDMGPFIGASMRRDFVVRGGHVDPLQIEALNCST